MKGKDDHKEFQRLISAYEVLRDPVKRAQYDKSLFGEGKRGSLNSQHGFEGPFEWKNAPPGTDEAWERMFHEWERRMKQEFGEFATDSEKLRREREEAQKVLRKEAWKREKMEAKANKARMQRVQVRAEQAKAVRHANILRKFWQTHYGITKWDALAALTFLSFGIGISIYARGIGEHMYVLESRQRLKNETAITVHSTAEMPIEPSE